MALDLPESFEYPLLPARHLLADAGKAARLLSQMPTLDAWARLTPYSLLPTPLITFPASPYRGLASL